MSALQSVRRAARWALGLAALAACGGATAAQSGGTAPDVGASSSGGSSGGSVAGTSAGGGSSGGGTSAGGGSSGWTSFGSSSLDCFAVDACRSGYTCEVMEPLVNGCAYCNCVPTDFDALSAGSCMYSGAVYPTNTQWWVGDGCGNSCFCSQGVASCTHRGCPAPSLDGGDSVQDATLGGD
jgi:hypothetical protein